VLVLVLGLAIVIVIVIDTDSNAGNDAADMAHGFRSRKARRVPPSGPVASITSGPGNENTCEHDDDCEYDSEHEHVSCVAEADSRK
jgi:hypothetical protein